MARRRTPLDLARVTGRDKHDPARFQGRNEPHAEPLGDPSDFLTDEAAAAFLNFRREIPWLAESDRCLVEIASVLRGRLIAGEALGTKALTALRLCISAMGATPTDRSKVAIPEDDDDDAVAARYFT